MINTRFLSNRTAMNLAATFYIQAEGDISKIYGTVNIELEAGRSCVMEFGNLRNNRLLGIRLVPVIESPAQVYCGVVETRGDALDEWLNDSETIELTMACFNELDACYSVEDKLKVRGLMSQCR